MSLTKIDASLAAAAKRHENNRVRADLLTRRHCGPRWTWRRSRSSWRSCRRPE